MTEVSPTRLNLLRAMYLIIALGLAVQIWPLMVQPPAGVAHMTGVVRSMLMAMSLVSLLGLRYPLRMLPVLLFELAWKVVWVAAIGLPQRMGAGLDAGEAETFFACMMGVVLVPLAVPWRHVAERYLAAPAERWRAGGTPSATPAEGPGPAK